MSFFDGFVNAARSMFGMPPNDDDTARRTTRPEARVRGEKLAADTATGFERARPSAIPGSRPSTTVPTLAERIRSAGMAAASGSSHATWALPPHLLSRGGEAPPTDLAPRVDAAASAALAGHAGGRATARARVIDASSRQELGTADMLTGTGPAAAAARNVQGGIDYFARTFGRDGLDDAGLGVDVLIGDRSVDSQGRERFAGNGGYFETTHSDGTRTQAIHFGAGKAYDAANGRVNQQEMQYADDLAVHELVHGVIHHETGHLGGKADEAGATNEAMADVMAAAATRDWRIGEGMYARDSDYRLMRNIAAPDDPRAIHGLWTTMDEVRSRQEAGEEVEEHWASGVLSTAAYRVQQRFGGEAGWNVVERVFYDSIDNGRLGDMSFNAVASGLRSSAAALYGQGSSVAIVLDQELRRAGL